MKYLFTGFLVFAAICLNAFTAQSSQPDEPVLCTPNPSREAKALYRYLNDMKGKKILSGQMWASWGYDELKYIKEVTGKQPAIRGMDFINGRENEAETQRAIDWWKGGGIPTIMWHWGAPGIGEGYENSKKPVDIDSIFIEGTPQNKSFWYELEQKANLLEKIRDAHVPVLWRPFHELNGNWFWWGKQGPEKFKKLWITVFDYLVYKRKINNLIWVLCYTGSPDSAWYPGRKYVDIAGADTYNVGDNPQSGMYKKVKEIVGNDMTIAYHECGTPPNPDKCISEGTIWSWWMEWHTDHLRKVDTAYLKYVYNHELIITLDEVPDIMKKYGNGMDIACKKYGPTENGLSGRSFLYTGEWDTRHPEAQKMFLVRDGKITWEYSIPLHPSPGANQEFDDITMMPDRNIVFARMSGAGIVTPDKKLIWEYRCAPGTETHSCVPIGKDSVLMALNGNPAKALIINTAQNKILKEIPIPTSVTATHGQLRHIRYTKQKTILVPFMGEGRVAEYTLDGKEIWSVKAPSAWAAVRLDNGNTLISGDRFGYTREVDPSGKTVWELTQADVPFQLFNTQTANRLQNGNTIISNWVAGNSDTSTWKGTVQFFEVTPEKKIVWVLSAWDNPDLGTATAIQMLDNQGLPDPADNQR